MAGGALTIVALGASGRQLERDHGRGPQGDAALLPSACGLCPRKCGINRASGERGACGADDSLVVARAALHFWEEPPISGWSGSGTVFFGNCPLHCCYCQNAPIANGHVGKAISVARLAEIFLEQQARGALNINLVTPTHYAPQIREALRLARESGLELPIVYNTSGYETVEAIRAMEGFVDIYLTDFKYASPVLAAKYSHAPDYPEVARGALAEMARLTKPYALGALDYGGPEKRMPAGKSPIRALKSGVIVRHLLLPGQLEDSKAVVRHVLGRYGSGVCLSLMSQYTPPASTSYPELRRTVTEAEYDELVEYALALGAENSFMQEGSAASESFIPAFDCEGV